MQPFGSQPATSFVFWLKAHNKPGKKAVYSVAQIVSRFCKQLLGRFTLTEAVYFIERVPNYSECVHGFVLPRRSVDLRWSSSRPPLADNHLRESSRDCHIRVTRCDTCVWAFLTSSSALYCVGYWWKCCPVDNGVSPFSPLENAWMLGPNFV
jgi:hypothetical protein